MVVEVAGLRDDRRYDAGLNHQVAEIVDGIELALVELDRCFDIAQLPCHPGFDAKPEGGVKNRLRSRLG